MCGGAERANLSGLGARRFGAQRDTSTNRDQDIHPRVQRCLGQGFGVRASHTRARTCSRPRHDAHDDDDDDDDDVRDDDFDDDDDDGDAGNQGGGETDDEDDESSARVRFISPIDDDARERRVSRVL